MHLGLNAGTEVVYVAKIGGHRQADAPSWIGGQMPLYATAIGKVSLAHAPEAVRRQVLDRPLRTAFPCTVVNPTLLTQVAIIVETGVGFEHQKFAVGIVRVAAPAVDQQD